MLATKFVLEKMNDKDRFSFVLRAYEIQRNGTWESCHFIEEVSSRWFNKKAITLL